MVYVLNKNGVPIMPTRNHAKIKFKTTLIPTVCQFISFRFLEKSHPMPRKTINPIMLIIRYIDMAVYPP